MTLVLAQASRWYALQVTDRLVSRGSRPWDPVANKNVVLVAPDGVLVLGYTGAAYLDGEPTDQRIAAILSGEEFQQGERLGFLRIRPRYRPPHLGLALQRLAEGLTASFRQEQRRHTVKARSYFEIVGVGFQWSRRGRWRPIEITLTKAVGKSEIRISRAARHFGRNFVTVASPEVNLQEAEFADMIAALRAAGRNHDQAECVLVETIRTVAGRLSVVGADCLSILIGPPTLGVGRVRYLPVSETKLALISEPEHVITRTAPAAFSPWIVAPGVIHSASVFAGQTTVTAGHFTIQLEAPELRGPGLLSAMGSLRRPRDPNG